MTNDLVEYKKTIGCSVIIKRRLTGFAVLKISDIVKLPTGGPITEDVRFVSTNMLLAASKLSGQILDALSKEYTQIAVVGLRTLFEMYVNAKYIFDHPDYQKNFPHMDKVCKDYIARGRSKDWKVLKNKLDEETIKGRMEKVGLKHHYETDYTEMCEWAHLMSKVLNLQFNEKGFVDFGARVASYCLCSLSNLIDSICSGLGMPMDVDAEAMVASFQKKYKP